MLPHHTTMSCIKRQARNAFLTGLLVALPALALSLLPEDGLPMLVYAPFAEGGAMGVLVRADARLLRGFSRADIAIVVDARHGLSSRLYAAGATLVLTSPQRAGCPA